MKIPRWALLIVPTAVLILGAACNVLVFVANGQQMPAYKVGCNEAFEDPVHKCLQKDAHLKILTDWIYVNGSGVVASPGDYLIEIGGGLQIPCIYVFFALWLNDKGVFGG